METIILAGGLGRRLRPVLDPQTPKPMAPVHGRPFLAHLFDWSIELGVERFILAVCHRHQQIQRHFGTAYRTIPIDYVIESDPLGTGGALRHAIEVAHNETTLVQNGDTLFDIDIRTMLSQHQNTEADLTLALSEHHDTLRYTGVALDANDRLIAFNTTSSHLINGGFYLMQKSLFNNLPWPLDTPLSLEQDIMPRWLRQNKRIYGMVATDACFIDIGVPEDYAKVSILLKE